MFSFVSFAQKGADPADLATNNLLKNPGFNGQACFSEWEIEVVEVACNQGAGFCWLNHNNKAADPAVKQPINGLKLGTEYEITVCWRGGDHGPTHGVTGARDIFAVDLDGREIKRLTTNSNYTDWMINDKVEAAGSYSKITFIATSTSHTIRFRGEVGADGDVLLGWAKVSEKNAQPRIVGGLEIGKIYTFESESGPGLFISYGATAGRAALNGANKNFRVVAPLNGKAGFVSLQASDLSGEIYLVMAELCPRPYTASNYYNLSPRPAAADATFDQNASFEVMPGRSDATNANLVSFRVKNGTHFFKREQGVFMNAPGASAPQYLNHFTFRTTKVGVASAGGGTVVNEKIIACEGREFKVDDSKKIWEKIDGKWVHIGDRCNELICNRRRLFCTSTDGFVWRYNDVPMNWTQANTLLAGQNLNAGIVLGGAHYLASANGKYFFYTQEDGNLGIYSHNPNPVGSWFSNTVGHKNCTLQMQVDGNLVMYNEAGTPIWSSETHEHWDIRYADPKYKPTKLVLENDGSLVLYSATNVAIWTNFKGKLPLN